MTDLLPTDFRAELRSWLAEHPPPTVHVAANADDTAMLREWQRTLAAARWVGVHWPVEYGGRGATLAQVAIYNEELVRAGTPPLLGRAGISLVGPTLMVHGTEAQRVQWMHRILDGTDIWCQLFSEPGAGSDLLGLSTKAVRDGDTYRVSGQKVWSSYATYADMGIALVRTDPHAKPHQGISMLAIPMNTPGIEVRPLRQITGDCEFNEVFFDNAAIPARNLIGPVNEGWSVANTTLANERGASFIWREQVLYELAMQKLLAITRSSGLARNPVARQKLAQSWIEIELFRLHNAQTLERLTRGEELGAHSSIVKLFWAGLSQRFYDQAVNLLGLNALLNDSGWLEGFLTTRANSIMGGSSEIQRNIIGERILGLPR